MAAPRVNITTTELPDSRVRVQAEVPSDEVGRTIERAARRLGQNLRVQGFRKGKAPAPVIMRRLGKARVLEEAMKDGLPRWYIKALDDSGVAPVGDPQIKVGKLQTDGQPLTFSVEVGVCPKATLGAYKGLEVGRREAVVDDDAVDAELQAVRERHARPQSVRRPAQIGDTVVIDFVGSVDGEPFEGGSGEGQTVELGSGMLVPGFEEQLVGAGPGDERTVEIDFPAVEVPSDHRGETVAGDHATFAVTVRDVKAKELPELDDALAAEAGFGSLAELREDLAGRLRGEDERRIDEAFGEAAVDAAVAEATVDVPDALVEARAKETLGRRLRSLDYQGIAKDVYLQIKGMTEAELLAEARPVALHELRREAVIAAVIEAEGIQVADHELREAGDPAIPEVDAWRITQPHTVLDRVRAQPRPGARRSELARRRAIELMAAAAVPISVADAQERGRPFTRDPEPPEEEILI